MNKLEINVFKLKEDTLFPHQKANISLGQFSKKFYKDKTNKIKEIGVLAKVVGIVNQVAFSNANQPVNYSYVKLDILGRIRLLENQHLNEKFLDSEYFYSKVELLEDEIITPEIKEQITKDNLFEKLRSEASKYFLENNINFDHKLEYNYVKYVFLICPYLRLTGEYKQTLLEINDLYERINQVLKYLIIRSEYDKKINTTLQTDSRNNKDELISKFFSFSNSTNNKDDSQTGGNTRKKLTVIEELENKLNSMKLPEEAKTIAFDELNKLKSQGGQNNPEQEWIINYLKTFVKLPWDSTTQDTDDLKKTKEILERDHFGLDKVKTRIVEYLSVRKLNKNSKKGSILCFNGPPGVGKTSLAKSIAESLNKKFYRLSLGGVRDESEIRGHRRTYIASMPGMIIQALIRAQSKNLVILLDEIDKVGTHFKGDVSSSLLEVLDPEQNSTFKDHYINTPFDLSEVFFICTSNYLENVSPPLRDRLEIIDISGYTIKEKIEISKKYLIPKQLSLAGLQNTDDKLDVKIIFTDDILDSMVVHYTWESGVRQLERNIASVCRHAAKEVVEELENLKTSEPESNYVSQDASQLKENKNNQLLIKPFEKKFEVDDNLLKSILGRKMLDLDLELRTSYPGVAIGLAYTLNGGALTLIECTKYSGRGEIIITGNMGEVMKESITTGFSWIKSNSEYLGLQNVDYKTFSLHIHVPQAAVPKDGPSAGVTMTVSIISLLKGKMTRRDTAMTGEISLQGFVLPVGGIKEKCLAAVRNKIKRVILPYQNKYDFDELPKETKSCLEVIYAKDVKAVIENAFLQDALNTSESISKPLPKF